STHGAGAYPARGPNRSVSRHSIYDLFLAQPDYRFDSNFIRASARQLFPPGRCVHGLLVDRPAADTAIAAESAPDLPLSASRFPLRDRAERFRGCGEFRVRPFRRALLARLARSRFLVDGGSGSARRSDLLAVSALATARVQQGTRENDAIVRTVVQLWSVMRIHCQATRQPN